MMSSRARHAQRGQVLPIWAVGIAAMLMLAMMVIRYADIVKWQIRAQNAADSAANAVLALQTEQLNEMTSTLYAASVEEYRIRFQLYALGNLAFGNGGCNLDNSCNTRYQALYTEYLKAVYRYHSEVDLLSQITNNLNFTTTQSDAAALLQEMNQPATCGNVGGLDCTFNYKLLNYTPRDPVYQVEMDAVAFILPSEGYHQTVATGVNPGYQPAKAEVSVCADIPSPVPGFFGFTPAPYRVVARSAVTAVMREQDWFQPGQLENPFGGTVANADYPGGVYYQNIEYPTGGASNDGTGFDWYAVQYGGNSATAYAALDGYAFDVYEDDFTKFVGWWASVPIRPYSGYQDTVQLGCAS
jgi:Flp pilus assembly protein TadG